MSAKKWTWKEIFKNKHTLTDDEMDKAILSMLPKDVETIIDKMDDGLELTKAEEKRLSEWEQSEESGPAGGIMGGF